MVILLSGDKKDIQEVKNAFAAYEKLEEINPYSEKDLKKIQGIFTFSLEKDAGKYRNHGEAVYDGNVQIFMAPPHKQVPFLMGNLFNWMKKEKNSINPLILSSIFHYEFVFIHPFSDGNGRTARYWQTAILSKWEKSFAYLPIESIIRKNQEEYYKVIQRCNNAGNSTEFIEFMLETIEKTLDEIIKINMKENDIGLELRENESKIIYCIEKNIMTSAKNIIAETDVPERTTRRILKKLIDNNIVEEVGSNKKSPYKKFKLKD